MRAAVILCINDEPTVLATRKLVLQSAGFRVLTARGACDGLQLFSTETVDAVVLDYFLPEVNGGQIAAQMKQMKPRVPILLLSPQPLPPEGSLERVDAFLTKGEKPEALLAALRSLLPPRSRGAQ